MNVTGGGVVVVVVLANATQLIRHSAQIEYDRFVIFCHHCVSSKFYYIPTTTRQN
jgi:hypothetical protein